MNRDLSKFFARGLANQRPDPLPTRQGKEALLSDIPAHNTRRSMSCPLPPAMRLGWALLLAIGPTEGLSRAYTRERRAPVTHTKFGAGLRRHPGAGICPPRDELAGGQAAGGGQVADGPCAVGQCGKYFISARRRGPPRRRAHGWSALPVRAKHVVRPRRILTSLVCYVLI